MCAAGINLFREFQNYDLVVFLLKNSSLLGTSVSQVHNLLIFIKGKLGSVLRPCCHRGFSLAIEEVPLSPCWLEPLFDKFSDQFLVTKRT